MAVPLALLLSACSFGGGADDGEPYNASIGSNEHTDSTDALGFALVDGAGHGRVVGALLNSTAPQRGSANSARSLKDGNCPQEDR